MLQIIICCRFIRMQLTLAAPCVLRSDHWCARIAGGAVTRGFGSFPPPRPSYCGASSCLLHSYYCHQGPAGPILVLQQLVVCSYISLWLHAAQIVAPFMKHLRGCDVHLDLALTMTLEDSMILSLLTASHSLHYRSDPNRDKHVHFSNKMRVSDLQVKPGDT